MHHTGAPQNHERKQAMGIIHQPKQVDEGGFEPTEPHPNFLAFPPQSKQSLHIITKNI